MRLQGVGRGALATGAGAEATSPFTQDQMFTQEQMFTQDQDQGRKTAVVFKA